MTGTTQQDGDVTVERDTLTAAPLAGLQALLDHDSAPWVPGMAPPLSHWLYFHPRTRQGLIGIDGHPVRNGDVDARLPRRMWAGGRVNFLEAVPIGTSLLRETRTLAAQPKTGRTGEMTLITLQHRFRTSEDVVAIEEEQDLVYRPAVAGGANPMPAGRSFETPSHPLSFTPDEAALFRFSALTFNAHRIHYDLPYAMHAEGYPALVVQGPFVATLLMDRWLRDHPGESPRRFTFRAERPLFCNRAIALHLIEQPGGAQLVAVDADNYVAMRAEVQK